MIFEIHQNLLAKKYSALELTQDYLQRATEKNNELNAFITITKSEALQQAAAVDQLIASGADLPLLAGVPASIKDVILVKGVRATAASKILASYVAPYDATVITKLKEQGMVLIGKNNCDEFAMGSSTENSAYQPTKNPFDTSRVPGGSSGGSAAAVAADMSVYALGSDTGGSIRQPASFCGVVGLKPTYGAVSRHGLMAMASSLDQIGPLAHSVTDAQIVFDAIKGQDKMDATSTSGKSINKEKTFSNLKIGVPKEYFIAGMDSEVEAVVKNTIHSAEKLGAQIVPVSLPHTEQALAVYYIIQPAETSANLARFDGIRYGQRAAINNVDEKLIDVYKKTRGQYFGAEVKRRIMLGTYILSAGYYDAYYKQAQKVRTLIQQDFKDVFNQVDVLLTPVAPHPAFKLGEKTTDPLSMYLEDVFTVPINVAGVPALSVPVGKTKTGLPIGAQIIGPWWSEETLFMVGKVLEN
ncbi:MAG TPA: Asp-tRNA(Asn)/Glu-tRNA(Gln) amidotransferase subunit GatA [bacterium]|nr:Asp-tRNA(Asn)/Glu-tRNA(Gln) amidotransferase subunit GatA [bacterium]